MANVRVENITKKYGKLTALKDVSFQCEEGEFFTLLGPSGAGKTTLLETIAGIRTPDAGKIYFDGHNIEKLPPQDRNVAMAFEDYALYSHMNVYENIAFPLRSPKMKGKMTKKQEGEKVREIASLLGIEHLLKRKPQQLSGGQKQRVSLARTMVRTPDVYLLDEPIAHLDAKLRAAARATLKRLARKFGTTIIYVTHNYREGLALADRILILREGEVQQVDTPEGVYLSPANDFTARLIGDPPINLMDGEIFEAKGATYLHVQKGVSIAIDQDHVKAAREKAWEEGGETRVRLGIRPKNLKVSTEKQSDTAFQLPVYAVVHEAEASVVTFELEKTFLLVKTDQVIPHVVGQPLWIDIDQDQMYFFTKTMEIGK
ncbi:MAG: ABC transporter ATP-binding protein [Deltaproteobacteria bacterium]|nr:ABC transporter ATP-binding protein [Deltaproteobacteria bacterium]